MRTHQRVFITALLVAVVAVLGLAQVAEATTVTKWTQKVGEMKKECKESGGLYSPPGKGGTASCVESDGSVTTCAKRGKNNCQNISDRKVIPVSSDSGITPIVGPGG